MLYLTRDVGNINKLFFQCFLLAMSPTVMCQVDRKREKRNIFIERNKEENLCTFSEFSGVLLNKGCLTVL